MGRPKIGKQRVNTFVSFATKCIRNRPLAGKIEGRLKRSFVLSFKMRGENRYMYADGNVIEVKNSTDERDGRISEELTLGVKKNNEPLTCN